MENYSDAASLKEAKHRLNFTCVLGWRVVVRRVNKHSIINIVNLLKRNDCEENKISRCHCNPHFIGIAVALFVTKKLLDLHRLEYIY